MEPKETKLNDWARILQGEVPPVFFIEAALRVTILYLMLLVAMRLMGKRMAAQLSRNEMGALVTLAAAIGVPLQDPERGLLPAFIIGIVVIVIGRTVAKLSFNHERFEQITQGQLSILLRDGTMDLKAMLEARISTRRLKAELRSHGVTQLGEIKRLYIEPKGAFSLIKNEEKKPGLCIIPEWDHEFMQEKCHPGDTEVCADCGYAFGSNELSNALCVNCGSEKREAAML